MGALDNNLEPKDKPAQDGVIAQPVTPEESRIIAGTSQPGFKTAAEIGSAGMKEILGKAKDGEEVIVDAIKGKFSHKEWNSGPQKGEKEDRFENGAVVHYKPDGNGGEIVEHTGPDGVKSTDHARPDGKGGVILERHSDNKKDNLVAKYSADGKKMTVDWADGRHLERYEDANHTVHTTMKGPNPNDNYTATESNGETTVRYADGAVWHNKDKKDEFQKSPNEGAFGKIIDSLGLSDGGASRYNTTFWQLYSAFWLSENQAAYDIRNRRVNGDR